MPLTSSLNSSPATPMHQFPEESPIRGCFCFDPIADIVSNQIWSQLPTCWFETLPCSTAFLHVTLVAHDQNNLNLRNCSRCNPAKTPSTIKLGNAIDNVERIGQSSLPSHRLDHIRDTKVDIEERQRNDGPNGLGRSRVGSC